MYTAEKILFYCVYLLCFFHILVLARGHGGGHGGHGGGHSYGGHGGGHSYGGYRGYHGHPSHSTSHVSYGRSRICQINVTSENGTFSVQQLRCNSCCENGCCITDVTLIVGVMFFMFFITIIIIVMIYGFYKQKISDKNINQEENLQMQSANKLNSVHNYGSNSYVNAAMSDEDLPSKLVDGATFKPSISNR